MASRVLYMRDGQIDHEVRNTTRRAATELSW
jgi:hypothetical protein